jgi:hypothetical protein
MGLVISWAKAATEYSSAAHYSMCSKDEIFSLRTRDRIGLSSRLYAPADPPHRVSLARLVASEHIQRGIGQVCGLEGRVAVPIAALKHEGQRQVARLK